MQWHLRANRMATISAPFCRPPRARSLRREPHQPRAVESSVACRHAAATGCWGAVRRVSNYHHLIRVRNSAGLLEPTNRSSAYNRPVKTKRTANSTSWPYLFRLGKNPSNSGRRSTVVMPKFRIRAASLMSLLRYVSTSFRCPGLARVTTRLNASCSR